MMRWRHWEGLMLVGGVLSAAACDCEPADPCVCEDTVTLVPSVPGEQQPVITKPVTTRDTTTVTPAVGGRRP